MRLAADVEEITDPLDYFDGSLLSTEEFVEPPTSLFGANRLECPQGFYVRTWRIADDRPARNMKTIEVRIEWPGETRVQELSTTFVKAS